MNKFVEILKTKRDTIVSVLMWEICKVKADAEKEFDRTIDYIVATIKAAKELRNSESTFQSDGGIIAQIRRGPLGVMLNLGAPRARHAPPRIRSGRVPHSRHGRPRPCRLHLTAARRRRRRRQALSTTPSTRPTRPSSRPSSWATRSS